MKLQVPPPWIYQMKNIEDYLRLGRYVSTVSNPVDRA